MATSPAPSPSADSPGGLIVHSVVQGLWSAFTSSPLVTVSVVLILVVAMIRVARQLRWSAVSRDPVRRFGRAERAVIKRRAGERCEHSGVFGRCRVTQNLEADHVHPHSRGGQTTVANGQALCQGHNRAKSARVPFEWGAPTPREATRVLLPDRSSRRRYETGRPLAGRIDQKSNAHRWADDLSRCARDRHFGAHHISRSKYRCHLGRGRRRCANAHTRQRPPEEKRRCKRAMSLRRHRGGTPADCSTRC
jgi:hypothetical protein